MMRVKRTTYAGRSGNDETIKLSLEIKQIFKQLQKDLKTRNIPDDHDKTIHSPKENTKQYLPKKTS